MPLRVGFDLDGTVADMYSALHREALKLFGEAVLSQAAHKSDKPQQAVRKGVTGAQESVEQSNTKPESSPEDDQTTQMAMQELHLTARQQMQLWDHVKKIENFNPVLLQARDQHRRR